MDRRDFLLVSTQALLLALFPWLRSERGVDIAGRAAERMYAFWLDGKGYASWAEVIDAACARPGTKVITVDESCGSVPAATDADGRTTDRYDVVLTYPWPAQS